MVENPPSYARDAGSIPGDGGTKILPAPGELRPRTATTEPTRHN